MRCEYTLPIHRGVSITCYRFCRPAEEGHDGHGRRRRRRGHRRGRADRRPHGGRPAGSAALVVEKAPRFGGSTARSGGGVWIPGNEVLRAGRRRGHAGAAPRRTWRTSSARTATRSCRPRSCEHGPAMLSFVLRSHAAEAAVGARLLRLLPGGARRAAARALGRAGAARRRACSAPTGRCWSRRTSPQPAGWRSPQADFRWLNLVARHPRGARSPRPGSARGRGGAAARAPSCSRMGQALAAGLWRGVRAGRRAGLARVAAGRPRDRRRRPGDRRPGHCATAADGS